MITMCLYFNHVRSPLLEVGVGVGPIGIAGTAIIGTVTLDDVALRDRPGAARIDASLNALRTCFVDRSASAAAALADVERDFVAEFDWLKRAAAMQRITTIVAFFTSGDVRALHLTELAYTARICAATAGASAEGLFNMLATAVTTSTTTF
jgi:hypothetical protein